MRQALYESLTHMAEADPEVVVVVSDLGSFEPFRRRFPERFLNVGVAEVNAVGVAAGLASEGRRVFLYGVAGFTLYRGFEQIKFSIGYWNQPVCIIGTGFGWRFHRVGRGHHPVDDIALMQLVPNMQIRVPASADRVPELLRSAPRGPWYLRLGEGFQPATRAPVASIGRDVTVLALGDMAALCSAPAAALVAAGIDVGVTPVESLDAGTVGALVERIPVGARCVVVEDHAAVGGLGALVRSLGFAIHRHVCLPLAIDDVVNDLPTFMKRMQFDERSLLNALDFREHGGSAA